MNKGIVNTVKAENISHCLLIRLRKDWWILKTKGALFFGASAKIVTGKYAMWLPKQKDKAQSERVAEALLVADES